MIHKKAKLRWIKEYQAKLAVSATVDREEAIASHLALLRLTKDLEQRVRSIQTLADLGYEGILPLVIEELVSYRKKPPKLIEGGA